MYMHANNKAKQFDRTNLLDGSRVGWLRACVSRTARSVRDRAQHKYSQSATDQPRGLCVLLLFTNDSSKNNRYTCRRSLCDVHVLSPHLTDSSSAAFDTAQGPAPACTPPRSLSILIMNPCIYICLTVLANTYVHSHTLPPGLYLTASLKSNVSRKRRTITSNEGIYHPRNLPPAPPTSPAN